MPIGRLLIILGLVLIAMGLAITYSDSLSWLRLGRLPGDIRIKRDGFSFYFPLTTCLLISLLLTFIFYLFRK